jgi:hypothetical protein
MKLDDWEREREQSELGLLYECCSIEIKLKFSWLVALKNWIVFKIDKKKSDAPHIYLGMGIVRVTIVMGKVQIW